MQIFATNLYTQTPRGTHLRGVCLAVGKKLSKKLRLGYANRLNFCLRCGIMQLLWVEQGRFSATVVQNSAR